MKRAIIIGFIVVFVIGSGCLGAVETSYEAQPVEINETVQNNYNYTLSSAETVNMNKTINLTDNKSKHFEITNWALNYRATEPTLISEQTVPTPKTVGIVSTPSITVLGNELNPLNKAPLDEIINSTRSVEDNSFKIKNKSKEISAEHQATGQDIIIKKYNSTLTLESGVSIDTKLLISRFKIDDSIVIIAGIYPDVNDDEDEMVTIITNTEISETSTEMTT